MESFAHAVDSRAKEQDETPLIRRPGARKANASQWPCAFCEPLPPLAGSPPPSATRGRRGRAGAGARRPQRSAGSAVAPGCRRRPRHRRVDAGRARQLAPGWLQPGLTPAGAGVAQHRDRLLLLGQDVTGVLHDESPPPSRARDPRRMVRGAERTAPVHCPLSVRGSSSPSTPRTWESQWPSPTPSGHHLQGAARITSTSASTTSTSSTARSRRAAASDAWRSAATRSPSSRQRDRHGQCSEEAWPATSPPRPRVRT